MIVPLPGSPLIRGISVLHGRRGHSTTAQLRSAPSQQPAEQAPRCRHGRRGHSTAPVCEAPLPSSPRQVKSCQPACKPGSVWRRASATAIHLGRRLLGASCNQPGQRRGPRWCCEQARRTLPPLFGFAPGGVYLATSVARGAVRSYRTLSPLLPRANPLRRFAFCGTFPGVAPGGR